MTKSMTGFGRAVHSATGWRVIAEVSSVNRKQSDIVISLPRDCAAHEPALRQYLAERISRGRVNVQMKIEPATSQRELMTIDHEQAKAYVKALKELAKLTKEEIEIEASDLLRAPGVVVAGQSLPEEKAVEPLLMKALNKAFALFEKSRQTEGDALAKELLSRLKALSDKHKKISALAPQVVKKARASLHKRLQDAQLSLSLDDERVMKEIAIFADRSDISEELARLVSHFQQFTKLMKGNESPGRHLDFLCQELHREFNTIGSKANDAAIAHLVVEAKTEVEKIREQVQNLE
jgi:uncharacterized protein (TIGR00255 family)